MDDHSYSMILPFNEYVSDHSHSMISKSDKSVNDHSYSTLITLNTVIIFDHSYSIPYHPDEKKKDGFQKKKQYKSNRMCSVYRCCNRSDEEHSLHVLPSTRDKSRRKQWIHALRMGKVPKCALVCDAHFNESDFMPISRLGQKRRLRYDAVPSRNLPVSSVRKIPTKEEKKGRENRALRAINRNIIRTRSSQSRKEDILFVDVENWSQNDDFDIKIEPTDVSI